MFSSVQQIEVLLHCLARAFAAFLFCVCSRVWHAFVVTLDHQGRVHYDIWLATWRGACVSTAGQQMCT